MKALANSAICPKCGGGHKSKPFCLYDNGWYCFACGYTKVSDRSYTGVLFTQAKGLPIPNDCTTNINEYPLNVREWLYKYNLTDDLIKKHNILLHKPSGNLVFFNIKNNEIIGYQKRNVISRSITTYGQRLPMLLNKLVNTNILVIVEDFISAIRINKLYNTVCLWGTKCSLQNLYDWFKNYEIILVWLDNDTQKETNSGQEAAKKILEMSEKCIQIYDKKRGWTLKNKKVINVVTEKDPKCFYNAEIQDILRRALNGY